MQIGRKVMRLVEPFGAHRAFGPKNKKVEDRTWGICDPTEAVGLKAITGYVR